MTLDPRAPGASTRPTLDVGASERATIDVAYASEFARLLRARFETGALLFVVVAGLGVAFEAFVGGGPPTRLGTFYPIQFLVLAIGMAASRVVPLGRATTVIVAASVM